MYVAFRGVSVRKRLIILHSRGTGKRCSAIRAQEEGGLSTASQFDQRHTDRIMKMKGIICHVLAVSAGLLTSNSVAGLDIAQKPESGDERNLMPKGHTESLPLLYDREIAETQAIFRDFEFTRSLRESELQLERGLEVSNDSCVPFRETCTGTTECCQGGCNSQNICFCQAPGGVCFKPGKSDTYCCSNVCNSNGKCGCIAAGASCAVGDGFCCEGYTCGTAGKCVKAAAVDRATCSQNSYVCSINDSCCSNFCGSNGRCRPAPTRTPTRAPTSSVLGFTSKSDLTSSAPCADPTKIKMSIQVKTDQYGGEVGWSVSGYHSKTLIDKVVNGTYGVFDNDQVDLCVSPGLYNFTLTDEFGDGVCCQAGNGHVKIFLNYREVFYIKSYGKVVTELLNVGFDPTPMMSDRDLQYLDAHNRRRFAWYLASNVPDMPLVWSPRLAEESRVWAEALLVNCSGAGIEHEHGVAEGENLAKNTGTLTEGGLGWGQVSEQSPFAFNVSSSYSNAYYCSAISFCGKLEYSSTLLTSKTCHVCVIFLFFHPWTSLDS